MLSLNVSSRTLLFVLLLILELNCMRGRLHCGLRSKAKTQIVCSFSHLPIVSKKNSSSFMHSVWKSQKKSHSTLRAKRACYIVSGQKLIKIGPFLILWSNSVTRYVYFIRDKNWLKMPKNEKFKCDKILHFQVRKLQK